MIAKIKLSAFILSLLIIFFLGLSPAVQAAIIGLNAAKTYQTFTGWEATDYVGEPGFQPWPSFPYYKDILLDKIVNDYGINRVRLEVASVLENNIDYYAQYLANPNPNTQWQWVHVDSAKWVDDNWPNAQNPTSVSQYINANPNSANIPGFIFHMLDDKIDNAVTGMRSLASARGEKLIINLTYVGFHTPSVGIDLFNKPKEYAEYMLAIFQHMKIKYGFYPDLIEIELEPDNVPEFSASEMGQAVVETKNLLAAHGFNPKFVVPCTTNIENAIPYFTTIRQTTGIGTPISNTIENLCYHRYQFPTQDPNQVAINIATEAEKYGIGPAMLEWWTDQNDYNQLHFELTSGRNTAWQEGTILGIYDVDTTSPTSPKVTISAKSKFIRQYTKYIRPGAVRIDATSDSSNFNPVAFINANGKYVVIVKSGGGNFSINGLPPATYGIFYTTAATYNISLPDVTLSSGQALSTNIPAAGAITIYEKTANSTISPTLTPSCPLGDLNGDCNINIFDYNIMIGDFGKTGTAGFVQADINRDGKVDIFDYNILIGNFGK